MPPAGPSSSLRLRGPSGYKYAGSQLRLRLGAVIPTSRSRSISISNKGILRPRRVFTCAQTFSPLRTPQPHRHQTRLYHSSYPTSSSSSTPSTPSLSSSTRPTTSSSQSPFNHTPIYQHHNRLRPNWLSGIMATATQTRAHAGHSHSHHDNVYLTSKNKNDAGVRITRIGLYSNLGMAVVKFVGGYMFNSQSMIADAWHSLTDLASDILTLLTVSFSLRLPTDRYPTGFGKVESLGSLGVSGMLLAGGIIMGLNSLETLYGHFFMDPAAFQELLHHGHGHSHGHSHGALAMGPSLNAAWLAAGTVAVKEWLYHASKS